MTDNPTTSAEMNIKEYAEQSYKGAALNAKLSQGYLQGFLSGWKLLL